MLKAFQPTIESVLACEVQWHDQVDTLSDLR